MSTVTAAPSPARSLLKLGRVETKLLFREPMAGIFGVLFPALLILVLGKVLPGFDEPDPEYGGLRPVDVYLPVVLALALATVALTTLPPTIATYRQSGVLRRLGTTPLPRSRVLAVQLLVQLAASVIAAVLAIVVAVGLLDLRLSENLPGFAVAFVLSAAALFAIGLLITAVAPTASTASGIGMAAYFPTLFFAGVWLPRDVMSDTLRTVSDLTPSGAAVQAIQDTWYGDWPQPLHLIVLVVWFVGAGLLATRLFRWE